jgi:hypothetical protein
LYLLIKPYFIRIFLQNIYTPIVHDKKKEQNYSTSIISLENSESSLPASNSESDSPNEIIKGRTFSNERFLINFAQSSEISSSQYLQKCWQISGVHFNSLSGGGSRDVPPFLTLFRGGGPQSIPPFYVIPASVFAV